MKPEIIEKIEQYLNDEMPPQQRNDFELQLLSDEELRNNFELYRSINTTMSALPNENELRHTLQQMNEKYFADGAVVKNPPFKKWLAIAASFILIIAATFYFILINKPSAEKLYAEYAQHTALNIQLRGSAADSLAQKAATAFNNKDYSNALPLLDKYLQQQPDDIQMKFATAISYLETGKYSEAQKIFTAIASGQTAYTDAAKWCLALTALKQNDFTGCRTNLNNILPSSAYAAKAKQLLNKLQE
jgi:tetratricopeptide (TPR) repeat protein